MSIVIDYGHIFFPNAVGAYDAMLEDTTGQTHFPFQFRANILSNLTHIIKKHWRPGRKVFLCLDGKEYWRKKIFPPYKVKRKEKKEEDNRDWDLIYSEDRKFVEEMKANLQILVIGHKNCEADDIVAVVAVEEASYGEEVIIVSSDKDFPQLQSNSLIKQYDRWGELVIPKMTKKIYGQADPRLEKELLILIGDKDDGIPNVFNTDEHYVPGKTVIKFLFGDKANKAKLKGKCVADLVEELTNQIEVARANDEELPTLIGYSFGEKTAAAVVADDKKAVGKWGSLDQIQALRNYRRNKKLIDLGCIPAVLVEIITEAMYQPIIGNPASTVTYITNKVGTGFLKDEGIPVLCMGEVPVAESVVNRQNDQLDQYRRYTQG